jgi:hypothetical protein
MKINCDDYFKFVLSIIILVFLVLIFIRNKKEKYEEPAFPEGEAKYYHKKENQFGIAQCKYTGETPILTCSYDSRV